MPYYKIASADLTNIPLLRKIATKGKPILLSTGASSLSEIGQTIQTIKKLILLRLLYYIVFLIIQQVTIMLI